MLGERFEAACTHESKSIDPIHLPVFYEYRTIDPAPTTRNLSNGKSIGDEMHTWFAHPIAEGRMAADQQRATLHSLRVAQGRDLSSRLTTALVAAADDAAARLQRRRATATAVVGLAR